MSKSTIDRIYGSLLGLAMGDSIGFSAMYHRTVVLPKKRRGRLWNFTKLTDEHRINKMSLPFTHAMEESILELSGTDDTEFTVVAAKMLMDCKGEFSNAALLDGWKRYVVEHGDRIWSGVSERASIENITNGILPPASGNDNPHHYDDGAVARAVPIGLICQGQPEKAAEIAKSMASITNAEDGVFAAQAMAASIAVAMTGAEPQEVVQAGLRYVPEDSWLGRKVKQAQDIMASSMDSPFSAIPALHNQVVNAIYNYANIAPETLAVAYAIFSGTKGRLEEGIQLASLLPKQADSMPAMVGALAGALQGADVVTEAWRESLDPVKGICIPSIEGSSLWQIANDLNTYYR
ncbi:ADP-ribosylglycohydrolase family protein [Bacillus horti]|uniref:ADP-ribosylglycohydrolase n=1 Tax=Caldalkalibacillus horti TaxID=77523 RepID=A0ABT9W3H9_9BACI|nr:ADP-ribosylglycohydrolase family protein [Bacillus horti]MDQ0167675.1 ADP-ribosylglycohydrolase [Bacillus horti]